MPITTSPILGSEVRVIRGVKGWSAEFRIEESALGGWDHEVGIMFVHDALISSDNDTNWPSEVNFWIRSFPSSVT